MAKKRDGGERGGEGRKTLQEQLQEKLGDLSLSPKGEQPQPSAPTPEQPASQTPAPEIQPEARETQTAPKISPNSRLYQEFAREYFENHDDVQDRFRNVDEYLASCLQEIEDDIKSKGRRSRLPSGCKDVQDLFKPYWETKQVSGVSEGSFFALEYGMAYFQAHRVELAHQIFPRLEEMKKDPKLKNKIKPEDYTGMYLDKWYQNFDKFLGKQKEKYDAGEIPLPTEGYEGKKPEEYFIPLSEEEIKRWFAQKLEELVEDRKKDFKTAKGTYRKKLTGNQVKEAQSAAEADFVAKGYSDFYRVYFPEARKEAREKGAAEREQQADFDLSEQNAAASGAALRGRSEEKREPQRPDWLPEGATAPDYRQIKVPPGVEEEFYRTGAGGKLEIRGGQLQARIKNFEADLGSGTLNVQFDGVDERKGVVRYREGLELRILLPKWMAVNWDAYKDKAEEVVAKLLANNRGSDRVRVSYDRSSGGVVFGFGDRDNPDPTVVLSPQDIRNIYPEKSEEVDQYMAWRRKDFDEREYETETQAMWNFENELLYKGRVSPAKEDDYEDSVQRVNLRQYVWDSGFRKMLAAELGQDKVDELAKEVEKLPSRRVAGTRPVAARQPRVAREPALGANGREVTDWQIGRGRTAEEKWGIDPTFGGPGGDLQKQHQVQLLLKEIKSEYGKHLGEERAENKLAFLANHAVIKQEADKFGLNNQELVAVLAHDILGRPELVQRYEEFKVLREWGVGKIRDITGIGETGKKGQDTKAAVLVKILGEILNDPNKPLIPSRYMTKSQKPEPQPEEAPKGEARATAGPEQAEAEAPKETEGKSALEIFHQAMEGKAEVTIPLLSQKTGLQGRYLAIFLMKVTQQMGYLEELQSELDVYKKENAEQNPPLENLLEAVKEIYNLAGKPSKGQEEQPVQPTEKKLEWKEVKEQQEQEKKTEAAQPKEPEKKKEEEIGFSFITSGELKGTQDDRKIDIWVNGKPAIKVSFKEFLDIVPPQEAKDKPEYNRDLRFLLLNRLSRLQGIPLEKRTAEDKNQLAVTLEWIESLMKAKPAQGEAFTEMAKDKAAENKE